MKIKKVKINKNTKSNTITIDSNAELLIAIQQLIDESKNRVAIAVNSELSKLYWHIGKRIQVFVLQGERAEYGKKMIESLSKELTSIYGKGWSEKTLRHCLRSAETF
jgi:predicted glycosyltransferase